MAPGTVPLALKLGDPAAGWLERDVEAWIAARPLVTPEALAAERRNEA
jgi:predicted DNA-binding transcriptional regulator AlpA